MEMRAVSGQLLALSAFHLGGLLKWPGEHVDPPLRFAIAGLDGSAEI